MTMSSNSPLLIEPVRATYKDGTNVTFSCEAGYSLVGEDMLYCTNQTWNDNVPECLGKSKLKLSDLSTENERQY